MLIRQTFTEILFYVRCFYTIEEIMEEERTMSAIIELVLGLFALTIVAAIFYPLMLVIFIINRKITGFLMPKQSSKPHLYPREGSASKFHNPFDRQ